MESFHCYRVLFIGKMAALRRQGRLAFHCLYSAKSYNFFLTIIRWVLNKYSQVPFHHYAPHSCVCECVCMLRQWANVINFILALISQVVLRNRRNSTLRDSTINGNALMEKSLPERMALDSSCETVSPRDVSDFF